MTLSPRLFADRSGNAAVEMALILPMLLALLFGSVELGNYFYNEHILLQAVRDGARYAARQDMSNFVSCSGSPGGSVVADTTNIVENGLLSGGSPRFPMTGATITVTTSCTKSVGAATMGGIYNEVTDGSGNPVGAPIITVSATVPYTPVLKAFGFSRIDLDLYASEQTAVDGW